MKPRDHVLTLPLTLPLILQISNSQDVAALEIWLFTRAVIGFQIYFGKIILASNSGLDKRKIKGRETSWKRVVVAPVRMKKGRCHGGTQGRKCLRVRGSNSGEQWRNGNQQYF